jgi:hypothetical protein
LVLVEEPETLLAVVPKFASGGDSMAICGAKRTAENGGIKGGAAGGSSIGSEKLIGVYSFYW